MIEISKNGYGFQGLKAKKLQGACWMLDDNNKLLRAKAPIVSTYINEEGMAEIINIFLDGIPKTITTLEASYASANRADFCKLIHQLKGAGGGYGFAEITTMAIGIETKLRVPQKEWKEDIQKKMDEFIIILQRVYASRVFSGEL